MPHALRTAQQGLGWLATCVNVLLDQTAWTIVINIVHFVSVGLLEGNPPVAVWRKLRDGLCGTLRYNWCFWPAIQLGVYGFVPVRHRLMAVMVCNFFWYDMLTSSLRYPVCDAPHWLTPVYVCVWLVAGGVGALC